MGLIQKREVLKIIFSLCSFLLISGFTWSQEVVVSQSPEDSVVVESDRADGMGRGAESQILLAPADVGIDATAVQGSSYGVWFFVRTVLVLAVVLALVWAFFVFLKRASGSTDNSDPYLKKVASLTLSPGKFVHVVTLNSKGYLVGVADNSVNLIAEIDDKELVDAMNLNAPQGFEGKGPLDFASILGKFRSTGGQKQSAPKKRSDGGFSSSTMVEFLQSQRSRLNANNNGEDDDVTP